MQAPAHDEFERMALAAYERLPAVFRKLADEIDIRIADFATEDVLAEMGIPDRFGLLGLYTGVDVTRKSLFDLSPVQDTIHLYRQPILHFWRSDETSDSLEHIIEHVLVHEIGHHFGLSDDDMHALEDEAEWEEGR